ncbi:MAG: isopentenyl-diphosphate Delta-isomerase [Candidatus Aenigmatarchaeota archaeon]
MPEFVVLVDKNDNELGVMEKIEAHRNHGTLHRAFSVFIFNKKGEMLLQQRAKTKYHFGGLWSNTCCSHPRKSEAVLAAAHRRLMEECGFDTRLKKLTSFVYQADSDGELSEHEFDHVFVGTYDGPLAPNPEEIGAMKWISVEELKKDIERNPKAYTPWFKMILGKVLEARQI